MFFFRKLSPFSFSFRNYFECETLLHNIWNWFLWGCCKWKCWAFLGIIVCTYTNTYGIAFCRDLTRYLNFLDYPLKLWFITKERIINIKNSKFLKQCTYRGNSHCFIARAKCDILQIKYPQGKTNMPKDGWRWVSLVYIISELWIPNAIQFQLAY